MSRADRSLICAIPLAAVVLLAVPACRQGAPEQERMSSKPEPRGPIQFPDTPAGKALSSHLETLHAAGSDAEARYQASLATLRAGASEVVPALVAAYDKTAKTEYTVRWALTETLAEVRSELALDALARIAREPLPKPEAPPQLDSVNPLEEETVIRMTAVRGLGYLAAENRGAADSLVSLARHEMQPIREEAFRALTDAARRAKDPQLASLLRQAVPPEWLSQPERVTPVPPPGARPDLSPGELRRDPTAPRVPRRPQ